MLAEILRASVNRMIPNLPMSPLSNDTHDTHDSLIGCTLGDRYEVQRVLGTGAMGTVYCARQVELGTTVAIKVLHQRLATDPGLVQRFEREAFAMSRLDHPNALRVLDFREEGDLLYLVTEYAEAEDLLAIMEAQWPFSDERIVAILSQVLSALIAVHEVGIVHRDLKPENILVLAGKNDDGADVDIVKVCDFGIAKVARPLWLPSHSFAAHLTAEGGIVGTPDYMSPEQARGQAVDGRSDLYSVGVVLYHLLAGQTPFTADSAVGIALQHVSEVPVPPSRHRRVHPALEAVCLRALSKQPEHRFQTAWEMCKALRCALTTGSTEAAMVLAPLTSFQLAPTFSTSSPAMLSLRPSPARSSFRENQRLRRRLGFGYAVAASVAAFSAAAFVAARHSNTTGAIETPAHVQATIALVSPPSLAATSAPPLTIETARETEPATAMGEPFPVAPPTMERLTRDPLRRIAPRGRQQPATKPQAPGSLVAASPSAPPTAFLSTVSTDGSLLRDPWPIQAEASAPSPRVAALSPSQPRESADTSHASVSFSSVVVSAGISGAKVKMGLSHVPLLPCYQQALRSRPTEPSFETELRLTIDIGGRVVGAALSKDGDLAGLRDCIESAAIGAPIRGVDTGDGSATVRLQFSPR